MRNSLRLAFLGFACLAVGACTDFQGLQLASTTARLEVMPRVVAGGFLTQALVAPWTADEVIHVEISFFTLLPAGVESPALLLGKPIVQDLSGSALGDPFTVTGLAPHSSYRLRGRAFKAPGTAQADLISDEAVSFVDVSLLADDRPAVATLSIRLRDVAFDGQGTVPPLEIQPGLLVPVGSESLQLGAAVTE